MEDVENGIHVTHESEVRKPLIQQRELAKAEESSSDGQGSLWMVLLSTGVAVCGSFEFGSCIGYSAPTQAGITKDIGLSLSQYSIFASILTTGGMVGAVTSGHLSDYFGRKGVISKIFLIHQISRFNFVYNLLILFLFCMMQAMRISAVVCIIGWLAIYFAKETFLLCLGRLFTGYGIGVLSYVVPVFIAEIAPKNLRGGLTSLNQLLLVGGNSVAFIIGTLVSWRALVLVGVLPCLVLLLGLVFIPESPRWLAKVEHQKESISALQKLRGKDADITQETAEIQECIENLQTLPRAGFQDLFQSRYIRSVIVSVGLMVFQQTGGINGVGFYASQIFVSAGFSSGNFGTILMGCIQVPITIVGAILMDRCGRIPLLMVSASGSSVGCFITGISFYLKGQGIYMDCVPTLALSGILVYLGSYSIGMGAVPWVMMSEIFPLNIKGVGGSLVTLVSWFGSWAVSYAFNFLMSWSSAGTFFLFSAAGAATLLFVARVVPETKGRSLEEIQESLNSSK
nr:PREDICTED: sugar transporter ERD6-like 16 isoform X1 [Musa acuminata subsp. malaccensis]